MKCCSASLEQLRESNRYEMVAIMEFTCRTVMRNFAVCFHERSVHDHLHLGHIISEKVISKLQSIKF